MLWINFLHFYQPPASSDANIELAVTKSYRRIIKALLKHNDTQFSLNINGCLLDRLHELGHHDLIDNIKTLATRGQVELVGSAAFHPLLPLIPIKEVHEQINLQAQSLQKYFGEIKLKGFFLPELAYSGSVAKLIKKLGYEWIILDEISTADNDNNVYTDNHSGLKVITRERRHSQTYVPQTALDLIDKNEKLLITATDAELYGLHYDDISGNFEKLLKHNKIQTQLVSDFIKNNNAKPTDIIPSSWESTADELKADEPYAIWNHSDNELQKKLWQLTKFAYKTINKNKDDQNIGWALYHLRRGMASCTFWWASAKDFSHVFNGKSWNPDVIEQGLEELIKSVRSLENKDTRDDKLKAEKLYLTIKKLIWQNHWQNHWQ